MYEQPFRSYYDREYANALAVKQNTAQVQSILSLYERNNRCLVEQVEQLLAENEYLKKRQSQPNFQFKTPKKIMLKQSAIEEAKKYLSKSRRTAVETTNKSPAKRKNHPRNAYLSREEIASMNLKEFARAKTAHKKYDQNSDFDKFKASLQSKKQQLRNSSERKNSHIFSMSRNPYLQQQSGFEDSKTAQKVSAYHNTQKDCSPIDGLKRFKSPGIELSKESKEKIEKQSLQKSRKMKEVEGGGGKSVTESRVKCSCMQTGNIYEQSNFKIEKPTSRWKDMDGKLQKTGIDLPYRNKSAVRFAPSNDQNFINANGQQNPIIPNKSSCSRKVMGADEKRHRRKFLSVISMGFQNVGGSS